MKEIIIVKVGNDKRPASQEDIDTVAKNLKKAFKKGKNVVVTHHAITFETISVNNTKSFVVASGSKTVV